MLLGNLWWALFGDGCFVVCRVLCCYCGWWCLVLLVCGLSPLCVVCRCSSSIVRSGSSFVVWCSLSYSGCRQLFFVVVCSCRLLVSPCLLFGCVWFVVSLSVVVVRWLVVVVVRRLLSLFVDVARWLLIVVRRLLFVVCGC